MIATLLLALYLLGGMDASSAITLLYIAGGILIVSEIFLGTFGFAALNGIIALYLGYAIKTGEAQFIGLPVDWGLFFGIAVFELILVITMITIFLKHKNKVSTIGTENMIGKQAKVLEWKDQEGRVFIEGENWQATSESNLKLKKNDKVEITAVNELVLTIKEKS